MLFECSYIACVIPLFLPSLLLPCLQTVKIPAVLPPRHHIVTCQNPCRQAYVCRTLHLTLCRICILSTVSHIHSEQRGDTTALKVEQECNMLISMNQQLLYPEQSSSCILTHIWLPVSTPVEPFPTTDAVLPYLTCLLPQFLENFISSKLLL